MVSCTAREQAHAGASALVVSEHDRLVVVLQQAVGVRCSFDSGVVWLVAVLHLGQTNHSKRRVWFGW